MVGQQLLLLHTHIADLKKLNIESQDGTNLRHESPFRETYTRFGIILLALTGVQGILMCVCLSVCLSVRHKVA